MAKPKLNPMQRALAQADKIVAANSELERVSRIYNDRRNDDPAKPAVDPAVRAAVGRRQSDMALGIGEFAPKKKSSKS